ncbi:hypothetical protein [Bacillus mycoides]|uniref:hypothetical protein n=1 Tax=Bacillus mycoides TaxID=1405 RepID=UPI003A807F50
MDIQSMLQKQELADAEIEEKMGIASSHVASSRVMSVINNTSKCMDIWNGFRYWRSQNRSVLWGDIFSFCEDCEGINPGYCKNPNCHNGVEYDRSMLNVYIEGLSFVLGLCNDFGVKDVQYVTVKNDTIGSWFIKVYRLAAELEEKEDEDVAELLLLTYLGLGEMLGIPLEIIEDEFGEQVKYLLLDGNEDDDEYDITFV